MSSQRYAVPQKNVQDGHLERNNVCDGYHLTAISSSAVSHQARAIFFALLVISVRILS